MLEGGVVEVHWLPMKARGPIYVVGATQEAQAKLTEAKGGEKVDK